MQPKGRQNASKGAHFYVLLTFTDLPLHFAKPPCAPQPPNLILDAHLKYCYPSETYLQLPKIIIRQHFYISVFHQARTLASPPAKSSRQLHHYQRHRSTSAGLTSEAAFAHLIQYQSQQRAFFHITAQNGYYLKRRSHHPLLWRRYAHSPSFHHFLTSPILTPPTSRPRLHRLVLHPTHRRQAHRLRLRQLQRQVPGRLAPARRHLHQRASHRHARRVGRPPRATASCPFHPAKGQSEIRSRGVRRARHQQGLPVRRARGDRGCYRPKIDAEDGGCEVDDGCYCGWECDVWGGGEREGHAAEAAFFGCFCFGAQLGLCDEAQV